MTAVTHEGIFTTRNGPSNWRIHLIWLSRSFRGLKYNTQRENASLSSQDRSIACFVRRFVSDWIWLRRRPQPIFHSFVPRTNRKYRPVLCSDFHRQCQEAPVPLVQTFASESNPSSSDLSEDVANTSVFRSFLRRGSDYVIFIVCWSFGQLEAFVRSVFAVSHAESSGGENKSGLRFQCRSSYPEMDFVRPLASFPSSHRLRGAIDADLP